MVFSSSGPRVLYQASIWAGFCPQHTFAGRRQAFLFIDPTHAVGTIEVDWFLFLLVRQGIPRFHSENAYSASCGIAVFQEGFVHIERQTNYPSAVSEAASAPGRVCSGDLVLCLPNRNQTRETQKHGLRSTFCDLVREVTCRKSQKLAG